MTRAFVLCVAILQRRGFTDARRRALSFVGQTSTFTVSPKRHRRRIDVSSKDGFLVAQSFRDFGSKFAANDDTSSQYLSVKSAEAEDDCLTYDYDQYADGDSNEENVDKSPGTEMQSSRSYILHKALFHAVQSALKNLNKKTTSLQRELEKAQSLEETMSRANLIVSNLYRLTPGTTSIDVEDWENDGKIVNLVLNTKDYSSAQEESDALFALARKMKRGSVVVQELLNTSLDAEAILKDIFTSLTGSTDQQVDASFDDISEEMHLDEGALVLIWEEIERTSKKTGVIIPSLEELMNTEGSNYAEPKGNKVQKSQRDTRYKPNPRELLSPSGHKGKNRCVFSFNGTRKHYPDQTLLNSKFLWDAIDATMRPFVFNCHVLQIFGCIRVAVLELMFYFVFEGDHPKSQMTICNLQLIWRSSIATTEQKGNLLLQQQNQNT